MCKGLPQLWHRVSWAFFPQAMQPSFCQGRMRTLSSMSLSHPRPARSAGKILLPKHSDNPSAKRRSVVVGPKVIEQVRIRRLPEISGRASSSLSSVLWATVTKGRIARMPRTRGHAALSCASSASVATRCRAATSNSKGLEHKAAIMAPCWMPAMKSGWSRPTARSTVTMPARTCFRYRFLVSAACLA